MKKKLMSILLTVVMIATMTAGCGNKTDNSGSTASTDNNAATPAVTEAAQATQAAVATEAPKAGGTIAFAWSYTSSDFFQALSGYLTGMYQGKGYTVETATAEGDATLQIEQMENFITMGVDCIVLAPVDPTGIVDACKKAIDAGIPVISFTSKVDCDGVIFLGSADEYTTGVDIANMGSSWLDANYADAAAGSVETVVLTYYGDEKGGQRSKGILETISKDPRVKVKEVEIAATANTDGQTAAENFFLTNPNTKLVLAYNSALGNGVNSYVMSANMGDVSKLAVFGCDESEEALSNVKASINNESILRGIVSLGGFDKIFADMSQPVDLIMSGKASECKTEYIGETVKIDASNIEEYMAK
jgi:ribose transport system substrate-binding protein